MYVDRRLWGNEWGNEYKINQHINEVFGNQNFPDFRGSFVSMHLCIYLSAIHFLGCAFQDVIKFVEAERRTRYVFPWSMRTAEGRGSKRGAVHLNPFLWWRFAWCGRSVATCNSPFTSYLFITQSAIAHAEKLLGALSPLFHFFISWCHCIASKITTCLSCLVICRSICF